MDKIKGNDILLELAQEYLSDEDIIAEIRGIIATHPEIVAIRGVFELINKNKNKPFTKEDREKIDDLFYFFG